TNQDFGSTPSDEMKEKIFKGNPREGVPEDFQKKYSYFPAVSKPIICAINGASVGVGFILPLYCDIRFASEEAKFGTAFSRRGLIAEHGVSWLLPRLVGISNALDLLYSARIFQAPEALKMGLVSRVLPADTLMEQARDYAGMLVNEVSPRSLREIKREVYNALFQTLGEAIDEANEDMVKSFACEDFKEGVAHFLEKRPPKFTGK
ncbi:MAG: enoyl-CoA hydratase-related protein, partial [Verrucomicrobia bacterium]|nr:enoyl-CoA hydratase-related protein [Verrucomicrobiota bacterium]